MPTAYVIAGPNGAGKTTFARDYLPYEVGCFEFINNDLIAAGLAPLQPDRAQQRAARIVLTELDQLARSQADFGFETTLAGRTYAAFLRKLRAQGYSVHLYFLWLSDVELHIRRVSERVRQSGHDVPEEDIRRRYRRSLVNFFELYQPLAHQWAIFENTGIMPRKIASFIDQALEITDPAWYDAMREQAEHYGHHQQTRIRPES